MTSARVDTAADGGLVRIAVAGEIDLDNAAAVEGEMMAAITNEAATVSVDLAEVTYLDSAGLRILFALVGRLATLQIAVRIVAPPGSPARRVVEMSGLVSLVPVDPPAAPRTGRGAGQGPGTS